ncbi:MAG: FUSC family protein, partial [Planctomycetes bacterium]|nr:FUSC family protein [Planctomycetota bacterium]
GRTLPISALRESTRCIDIEKKTESETDMAQSLLTRQMNQLYFRHGIKTGLACAIAYIVSVLLGSPYPVWAVISTIIVMQGTSVAESLQASLNRFTGMALGALAGVVLSLVFAKPENMWWIGCILFIINGLGAYLLQYGARYMLVSVAATIVLLVGHIQAHSTYEQAAIFGFTLIWEIAVGVGAATLVSVLLWPVRMAQTLQTDVAGQFAQAADVLRQAAKAYVGQAKMPLSTLAGLAGDAFRNRDRIDAANRHEGRLYNERYDDLAARIVILNRTITVLGIMLEVLNELAEPNSAAPLADEAIRAADAAADAMIAYGGSGDSAAPDVADNVRAALTVAKACIDKLCNGEMGNTALRSTMRSHALFRLIRQIGEFYAETGSAVVQDHSA